MKPAVVNPQYVMTVKTKYLPGSILRALPRLEDNTVNQAMLFLRLVKVGLRPGSWTGRAAHSMSFPAHI